MISFFSGVLNSLTLNFLSVHQETFINLGKDSICPPDRH